VWLHHWKTPGTKHMFFFYEVAGLAKSGDKSDMKYNFFSYFHIFDYSLKPNKETNHF
jgi:hypothetical protein